MFMEFILGVAQHTGDVAMKPEQRSKLRKTVWASLLVILGAFVGINVPTPVATGVGEAIEQAYQSSKE